MHDLRHRGVQGVKGHLQLVDVSVDSLSLNAVMMRMDKNKPFSHLFKAHHHVTVTSLLIDVESRAVHDMPAPSLEISGPLPPNAFPYWLDVRPSFLVVALRATIFSSLERHGSAPFADWDSVDAFRRQQSEDGTRLHSILQLPLDVGPWAVKYYDQLRIRGLTDGSAPPYITQNSWNQGDNLSGNTY